MTTPASAYPRTVEDLVPEARHMIGENGEIPSLNRLMTELRIGNPKAKEVRSRLSAQGSFDDVKITHGDSLVGPVDLGEIVDAPAKPQVAVSVEAPSRITETDSATQSSISTVSDKRRVAVWPIILLAAPAFVAVWSGWVGLGAMCGFGVVDLLPGIVDAGGWATLDTSITLPIGAETYGAYALWVWLSGRVPERARNFAAWSAITSLVVGALGQVAYHILETQGATHAPAWIVVVVATLPVIVLGMGATLAHMVRSE